jgi:hypothetical protein
LLSTTFSPQLFLPPFPLEISICNRYSTIGKPTKGFVSGSISVTASPGEASEPEIQEPEHSYGNL